MLASIEARARVARAAALMARAVEALEDVAPVVPPDRAPTVRAWAEVARTVSLSIQAQRSALELLIEDFEDDESLELPRRRSRVALGLVPESRR